MPLYHKYGVVFIQIPKNASISIHYTMRNRTDDQHAHYKYLDEYSNNDTELFSSYTSFACVRNPYDRFVSIYEYRTMGEYDPNHIKFNQTIEKLYLGGDKEFDCMDLAYSPQYKFITIKNIILVDEILRFENLKEDWKNFVSLINSKNNLFKLPNQLQTHNVTPSKIGKKWQDYYTKETADMIYQIYKKDFQILGYEKKFD